jgi:hypothetical protein
MGAPVLVGAGVGALTSLATGRDPLAGAALGGLSGGAFGGSTGFGSGFTEGGLFNLGSVTPTIPQIATEGVAQSAMTAGAPSSLLSGGGLNVDMALNPLNVGMGGTTATQAGFQSASPMMNFADATGVVDNAFINPSTYTGGLDDMGSSGLSTGGGYIPDPNAENFVTDLTAPVKTGLLEDIGSTAYDSFADMSTMDKVGLGAMTLDAFTPEEQAQVQAQVAQISPPKEVTVGTPLAINMPTRTFKPRFA